MSWTQGASRPGNRPPGQDRWGEGTAGIVVLDGATAYSKDGPEAGKYVDQLRAALLERIDGPADLPSVLESSISATAVALNMSPGGAPSSTVLLLRTRGGAVELLVLGDSTAVIALKDGESEFVSDDRLDRIASPEREEYRARLRGGSGYDEAHRELLRQIQDAERSARNSSNGYWIAEAEPEAARNALTRTFPLDRVRWVVLATDGAQRPIDHLGITWGSIVARARRQGLQEQLGELHAWEEHSDPDGRSLPRSKRHDDKTLVTWEPGYRP